jgi:hypothetical protein
MTAGYDKIPRIDTLCCDVSARPAVALYQFFRAEL